MRAIVLGDTKTRYYFGAITRINDLIGKVVEFREPEEVYRKGEYVMRYTMKPGQYGMPNYCFAREDLKIGRVLNE